MVQEQCNGKQTATIVALDMDSLDQASTSD